MKISKKCEIRFFRLRTCTRSWYISKFIFLGDEASYEKILFHAFDSFSNVAEPSVEYLRPFSPQLAKIEIYWTNV